MTPNENGLQSAATLPEAIQTPSLGEGDAYGATLRVGVNERREMAVDRAETGCRSRAERGPATGAALPCQNSNNYPGPPLRKGYKLRRAVIVLRGRAGSAHYETRRVCDADSGRLDGQGRVWARREDGEVWERLFGGITSAEAKRAFALRLNVEGFFRYYGREQSGFLTFSPDRGTAPRELARRFNDARKHGLRWLRSYTRVLEPRQDGTAHHHLTAAVAFEVAPEAFDWDSFRATQRRRAPSGAWLESPMEFAQRRQSKEWRAYRAAYVDSAPDRLREAWKELRAICAHYRLGRAELLPLRKEAGAVAHYVGAYLESGLAFRKDSWKGVRRVEYDRRESMKWKCCGSSLAWHSPGARDWRQRVGELAMASGLAEDDLEGLRRVHGARWAYHWRPSIMVEPEPEWRKLLVYCAELLGGRVERKPMLNIGGNVCAYWSGGTETWLPE